MIRSALLLAAIAAHESAAPPSPALPWVSGFHALAIAGESTRVTAPFVEPGDPAMAVRADVRGDGTRELVIASAHGGLVVADADGRVVARSGELPFEGSADDLVGLAVGDAHLGAPIVLVAVQRGGHRISTVALAAFRVTGDRLERVFAAPVELHDGDATATGGVVFGDGTLVYRAPGG